PPRVRLLPYTSLVRSMGRKSAENLVEAIDKVRSPSLGNLLFALGIRQVGETTARDLAQRFGSIEALMQADEEALLAVNDVGPVRSEEHTSELQSRENL